MAVRNAAAARRSAGALWRFAFRRNKDKQVFDGLQNRHCSVPVDPIRPSRALTDQHERPDS